MFGPPPRSTEQELEETLARGRRRFRQEPPSDFSPLTILKTLAWLAALVAIAFVLVQTGIIDPGFCDGTANPMSC